MPNFFLETHSATPERRLTLRLGLAIDTFLRMRDSLVNCPAPREKGHFRDISSNDGDAAAPWR